jgi:hypothetical protein
MRRLTTMRDALADPEMFGAVLPGPTWEAWRVVLIASQGEPLTEAEREIFRELTGGREREPDRPCKELVAVCGRRAGKTRAMAVAAAYFARCIDYTDDFAPGQRGRVPVMAAAKDTAKECLNYILGVFQESPACREYLDGDPIADTIRLTNRIDIQVMTASFKTTRGPTPVAAVADEIAFWSVDGANPDTEVLRALRPGLGTLGGPLFVLSSPHARRGALWDLYRKNYGPDGNPRVLVIQAPTQTMHRSETLAAEEEAYRDDPVSASAEWGAQFRTDSEAFVSIEVVQACTPTGIREVPPVEGQWYAAFVDVSGGGADSHAMAIAHRDGDLVVLDAVREMRGSPEAVTEAFAALCKTYRVHTITGDRYGAAWVRDRFAAHGVTYEPSERSKSEIYRELLPILNSERCRLLDVPKLEGQLTSLERRTTRGTGKETIDHPQMKGAHDDVANAVAGAIVSVNSVSRPIVISPELRELAKQPRRGRSQVEMFNTVMGYGRRF